MSDDARRRSLQEDAAAVVREHMKAEASEPPRYGRRSTDAGPMTITSEELTNRLRQLDDMELLIDRMGRLDERTGDRLDGMNKRITAIEGVIAKNRAISRADDEELRQAIGVVARAHQKGFGKDGPIAELQTFATEAKREERRILFKVKAAVWLTACAAATGLYAVAKALHIIN